MKLHLVGGFLGSGKTTAIAGAARLLMRKGLRVGVVTNDQGKHLVDTAFFASSDIPTVEVTGGCFCCNYDDLEERLSQLEERENPHVVFAESVGSCADVVATVLKPLLRLNKGVYAPASFSVFADGRLLQQWLLGRPMPFSEDVVYIFEQQLEEAGLIVINKTDLLAKDEIQDVVKRTQTRFPMAVVRFQNSLDTADIVDWVALLDSERMELPGRSLDIDYDRYAKGEKNLLWLDERLRLIVPPGIEPRDMIVTAIRAMVETMAVREIAIGHLKFLVSSENEQVKISVPSGEHVSWDAAIPSFDSGAIEILINARVQTERGELRTMLHEAVASRLGEATIFWSDGAVFRPGRPVPTFRLD